MTRQSEHRISDFAKRLIAAREGAPKIFILEDDSPLEIGEAYEIQAMVAQCHGPAGGFKVARKPDQPLIMAPIFQRDIQVSPARWSAPDEASIGVELEIGFRILSPLPSLDEPAYTDRLKECVALVPAIEIVLSRLADADAAAMYKLADNQINGGLIVGQEVSDWRDMDLTQVNARLTFDGRAVIDGTVPVPGGDAFGNFQALVAHLGDHCGGLKPGHVVITGSLNGLPYVSPGTKVRGSIEGLGDVAVDLLA